MTSIIVLSPVCREDLPEFSKNLQAAFAVAVEETFGPQEEPIPPDRDVWETMEAPGAAAYHIVSGGARVGGVIVSINEETQRNRLDFFFIDPRFHGHGLGFAAWQTVERLYPNTKVWETGTPYFEQRNIHFYVNKCGFHIVEFYHKRHAAPNNPGMKEEDYSLFGGDGFFRFEKVMR